VLDADIREDDAETVASALRMIRGVAAVDPVPADPAQYVVGRRVRMEVHRKIIDVLDEDARGV